MVDILVLDGGSENQKGVDLTFEAHQTLLIHCPPHVLHLLWGDITKPDLSFLRQLNFAGNWIRNHFNVIRKYVPLSSRQMQKENAKKQKNCLKALLLGGTLFLKRSLLCLVGLVTYK